MTTRRRGAHTSFTRDSQLNEVMLDDEWFVRVQGKEYGPVDLETLREWKREGRLIADNELRNASNAAWMKASAVAEIFAGSIEEKPPPLFMRRRTFSEIISETFQIYRKGFLSFFVLALLVGIPTCIVQISLAYLHLPEQQPLPRAAIIASTMAIIGVAVFFALWPVFIAGIQIATADLAAGRSIRLRDVLQRAVHVWPKVGKLSLIVYGSYFLWSVIPVLAIFSLVAAQPSIFSVLLALGILTLQVYMTARLWVNFLFWQQTSVLQTSETLEALRESQRLARSPSAGPWYERPVWRGAFLVSIWFLLLIFFSSGAEVPFLLVRLKGIANPEDAFGFIQNLANAPAPDAMMIMSYVFSSLIHALLRPLLGIAFVILYFEAKS
jgi:uncharacterized protein DUF4339